MVLSILFSEVLGLAAGGMVVPGYLAMEIHHPGRLAMTFPCALLTFAVVQGASRFMVFYGRRRTAAMILVGFLLRYAMQYTVGEYFPAQSEMLEIIGHIIPGLIAIWMAGDRGEEVKYLPADYKRTGRVFDSVLITSFDVGGVHY